MNVHSVLAETHTRARFFPVGLLSQSNYSRQLPRPGGRYVNFKVPPPPHPPPPSWKTGASVHENAAGGCICMVPVPSGAH